MYNLGMTWETEAGSVPITKASIQWIIKNVKSSQYTNDRCYVYNKAFARYFDNNDSYLDPRVTKALQDKATCNTVCDEWVDTLLECIRTEDDERGFYDKVDVKKQYLKLLEAAREIGIAIRKEDTE